jgi:hypothetical protein
MGEERLATIRGTLKENGSPLLDATVYLQSFDNEGCANLFNSEAQDRRSAKKLSSCIHDVRTTIVEATGSYQFIELKAGWYAVHFLWNIKEKPSPYPASFVEGNWRAVYAGHKDSTGKYDSMAQDRAIFVAPGSEIQRNFDGKFIAQEAKPLRGQLSLPTKNWGIAWDLPGFTLRVVETKPGGQRYMVAENETTHVVVSVTVEEIQNGSRDISCESRKLKLLDIGRRT